MRILVLAALLGAGGILFGLNRSTMLAIEGGQYVLGWHVTGFGGGKSSGGGYTVSGAAGQANADELSGGAYNLGGGFLGGGARVVLFVTPTATPTVTSTPTPTATPTTTVDPVETATPTATPALPGNVGDDVQLYLPLVNR
jgi:hypothetical protein